MRQVPGALCQGVSVRCRAAAGQLRQPMAQKGGEQLKIAAAMSSCAPVAPGCTESHLSPLFSLFRSTACSRLSLASPAARRTVSTTPTSTTRRSTLRHARPLQCNASDTWTCALFLATCFFRFLQLTHFAPFRISLSSPNSARGHLGVLQEALRHQPHVHCRCLLWQRSRRLQGAIRNEQQAFAFFAPP